MSEYIPLEVASVGRNVLACVHEVDVFEVGLDALGPHGSNILQLLIDSFDTDLI